MTIKELYEWAKESERENLPLSIEYWNEEHWGYLVKEILLSDIIKDDVMTIIEVD